MAGFIGSLRMNMLKGAVEAVAPGQVTVRLPGGAQVPIAVANGAALAPGTDVTVGVRPEDVGGPGTEASTIAGRVLVVDHLGSETYVYVKTEGDQTLVARRDPASSAAPDQNISLALPPGACHLFGPDGNALGRVRTPAAA